MYLLLHWYVCTHLIHISIWMETGVCTKNTLRYISINQICQAVGINDCKALPAIHAFTGCDYTASFSRKGKIRHLKLLEKDEEAQYVFCNVGFREVVSEDTSKGIERFVCKLYGQKHLSSVDEARFQMFLKKY